MVACPHHFENEGPRIPLRYGSAATMICTACGAWRQTRVVPAQWEPAETLSRAFTDDEAAIPAAPNQLLADSVVERVAEAIWKAAPAKFAGCFRLWHEETPENKQVWAELARAAIAAIPSAGGLSETEERLARAEIKNACGPSSASEFPSSAGGVERKEDIQLIENIKWKSVDKDNMEYEARISCYQLDAINRLINKGT
jgi:hypothetical protein